MSLSTSFSGDPFKSKKTFVVERFSRTRAAQSLPHFAVGLITSVVYGQLVRITAVGHQSAFYKSAKCEGNQDTNCRSRRLISCRKSVPGLSMVLLEVTYFGCGSTFEAHPHVEF